MMLTKDAAVTERRGARLDMPAADFRVAGHALVDQIADWFERMPAGKVTPGESPAEVRIAIRADRALPAAGTETRALLKETADVLFRHSTFNGHPRFFGYITSSAAPIGALADLLAASINQNVGAWALSPAATEIEAQTVRWIAELIGYPASAGGLLVSGGNVANLVCFLAARTAKAGETLRTGGLRSLDAPLRLYASTETHTWLQKAVDMSGLGTDAIRWIGVDENQMMNVAALEAQIAADQRRGERPFLVVGTAGTVSTGVVDPLAAIADICRRHDLWFHVDGAYGALAARVPGAPDSLEALAEADSVAVDPHKWLYAPLEAGCVLVRRPGDLRQAFSYHPSYYQFDQEATNYYDYGPQNSRGFRALKVWLALRQAGAAEYLRMIGDDMRLARHLHALVEQHPDFDACSQHLSITTFRYIPADCRDSRAGEETAEYLDRLNQELRTRVEQSGEAFLSNAIVAGRFALRACIVNFRTTVADVEAMVALVARLGAQVHDEMKQSQQAGH